MSLFSVVLLNVAKQPSAKQPPGAGFINDLLGWMVWIAGAAAVGVFIWIAIQMMVGRRNRSQMAADGLSGLPWVVGGLILVAVAASLTNSVLSKAKPTAPNGNNPVATTITAP